MGGAPQPSSSSAPVLEPAIIKKESNRILFASNKENMPHSVACQTAFTSSSECRQKPIPAEFAQSQIDVTTAACRLGTDKYVLMDLYEKVHSNFLGDMIGIAPHIIECSRYVTL